MWKLTFRAAFKNDKNHFHVDINRKFVGKMNLVVMDEKASNTISIEKMSSFFSELCNIRYEWILIEIVYEND